MDGPGERLTFSPVDWASSPPHRASFARLKKTLEAHDGRSLEGTVWKESVRAKVCSPGSGGTRKLGNGREEGVQRRQDFACFVLLI